MSQPSREFANVELDNLIDETMKDPTVRRHYAGLVRAIAKILTGFSTGHGARLPNAVRANKQQ